MGGLLGETSRATAREYGFMLSALAVLTSSEMPSAGFFDLAKEFAQEFRGRKAKIRRLASHDEISREG